MSNNNTKKITTRVLFHRMRPLKSSSQTRQSLTSTSFTHPSIEKLQQQNKRLKMKLKHARDKLTRKDEEIKSLQSEIMDVTIQGSAQRNQKHEYTEGTVEADYLYSGEVLTRHFSEVIRRHDEVLEQKDRRIRELEEALARCQARGRDEVVLWSHDFRSRSSITDERLRRTEAAVRVFQSDLDSVKNQLQHSPLNTDRWPVYSTQDGVILRELKRRDRFGMVADLEKMGQSFMQRLELEEKLDKLHWQIESKRFQVFKDRTGVNFEPNCTYAKEFEMLEITRHNLLKALADLRAQTHKTDKAKQEGEQVQFKNDMTLNTIQNTYTNSSDSTSHYNVLPDK
uniref:Uncharacterized protein n=1 Tax=Cuerna arida TaxID=1464854 RepID=A0A1B6ELV3_9HEMI